MPARPAPTPRPLTRTIVADRIALAGITRHEDHLAGKHTRPVLGCPKCER